MLKENKTLHVEISISLKCILSKNILSENAVPKEYDIRKTNTYGSILVIMLWLFGFDAMG